MSAPNRKADGAL